MLARQGLSWLVLIAAVFTASRADEKAAPDKELRGENRARTATNYRLEAPDPAKWTVSLNGTWQFATAGSTEFAPVMVPGYWSETPQFKKVGWKAGLEWKSGTYRRNFQVPKEMPGAVLAFDMIRWGGEVLVNGKSAGSYNLGYSQVSFDVSGLIKPGANRLEVRLRGWAALERHEGKSLQIPSGAGDWFGPKAGGIPSDVFLYLYKGVRIGSLRIVPRIAGPACDLSTRVTAGQSPWEGVLAAQVISDDGKTAFSSVKRQAVRLKANEAIDVGIKDIQAVGAELWSPDSPTLYRLVAWLEPAGGGSVAAARADTFGFREVAVKDGRFHLNGRPVALFGATELVMGRGLELLKDEKRFRAVQVKLFKHMNGVAVRTHINPLPRKWLDLCDRNGVLVFPEFPNFPGVQGYGPQDPYKLPLYWKNLQQEVRGIIANRFNHPSIIGWSASNEGNSFGDWERQNLVPLVKSLDPTRLVMLSADVTDDIADQHNFAGTGRGTQADFETFSGKLAEAYPDAIVGNTEYAQFDLLRWFGNLPIKRDSVEAQKQAALIRMEQTEALRRARFDIIMPWSPRYGRAYYTGRAEDAGMAYHALRNALSPLAVSLDFSRRHAQAGQKLKIPVCVMSDSELAKGSVNVDVYMLDKHPGFNWDGKLEGLKVLSKASFAAKISPWSVHRQEVTIEAPAKTGSFELVAVLTKKAAKKPLAISLRPLRTYRPLGALKRLRIVGVIEKGDLLTRWLRRRGHRVVLPYGRERPDVIIIGEGILYDTRVKEYGSSMAVRVREYGTRLIILEQAAWDVKACSGGMRKLLDRLASESLGDPLESLFPEANRVKILGDYRDYRRLNGLGHVGLRVTLMPIEEKTAAGKKTETKPIDSTPGPTTPAAEANPWQPLICAFGRGKNKVDWALVHRKFEKGEIFACQIPLSGRVNPENQAEFDPVAERLLAFLIEGGL